MRLSVIRAAAIDLCPFVGPLKGRFRFKTDAARISPSTGVIHRSPGLPVQCRVYRASKVVPKPHAVAGSIGKRGGRSERQKKSRTPISMSGFSFDVAD
ncbi:MAG: hypothetical protein WAO07_07310 [Desulfobacterales bacterium]